MMKKIIVLFLIFAFSIKVFAAAVSDNDGASFITKAEFDSLKNEFQKQLNDNNRNIDSKIENAVSSYIAGLNSEKVTAFTGATEVKDANSYIYSRKQDYNGITKQIWNDITYTFISWAVQGTHTGNVFLYPFYNHKVDGSDKYSEYAFHSQVEKDIFDYNLKGYVIDNNGVVKKIYNNDNISIVAQHFGAADLGGGSTYAFGYTKDQFEASTRKTSTIYTDFECPPGRFYRNAGGRLTTAEIRTNISTLLPTNDKAYFTPNGWRQFNTTGLLMETYDEKWSFYHTVGAEDKDKNIYNYCNIPVYAYIDGETELETFNDPLKNSSIINPDTGSSYSFDIVERGYDNQICATDGDTDDVLRAVVIGQQLYDSNASSATPVDPPEDIWKSKFTTFLFKVKLKNKTTNTAIKPTIKGYNESTAKFNNLSQLKNGKLQYTNKNSETDYPHYYGGIPIFNRSEKGGDVKFKIKFSGTSGRKIRLYVKKYEFPNGTYSTSSASWTAINTDSGKSYLNDLVTVTTENNKTNTNKYIDLNLNTEETVSISDIDADTPYFIRFEELNGSTPVGYGGTLTYLSDFTITTK